MNKNCKDDRKSSRIDGYALLRMAIVQQAVKDYKHYYRIMKRNPDDTIAKSQMEAIERFFLSQWFEFLMNLDGAKLISNLKEMLENERKPNRRYKSNG